MTTPENLQNGLLAETAPNGNVSLTLISDGVRSPTVSVDANAISMLIVQLVGVASLSKQQSGTPIDKSQRPVPYFTVTGFGMMACPIEGHELVTFRAGDVLFGAALPRASLRELGQKMMAVGADNVAH
jgi:hypothetical protein